MYSLRFGECVVRANVMISQDCRLSMMYCITLAMCHIFFSFFIIFLLPHDAEAKCVALWYRNNSMILIGYHAQNLHAIVQDFLFLSLVSHIIIYLRLV